MKVCELIERLKQMKQLAEVQVHVNIEEKGVKFEATKPVNNVYMGNDERFYDLDKSCLIIIDPA